MRALAAIGYRDIRKVFGIVSQSLSCNDIPSSNDYFQIENALIFVSAS